MGAWARRGCVSSVALLLLASCSGVETRTRGEFPASNALCVGGETPRVRQSVTRALRDSGAHIAAPDERETHFVRVTLEVTNLGGADRSDPLTTAPGARPALYNSDGADPFAWAYAVWVLVSGLVSVEADSIELARRERNPANGPLVTLTLTLIETESGRELWCGVARDQVADWRDPTSRREWIANAVRALMP